MIIRTSLKVTLLSLAAPIVACAQTVERPMPGAGDPAPAFSVSDALASSAGGWSGELQYLDYQSGEWFGIPVDLDVSFTPDGHTQIRRASYDDGPQAGTVYITSVSAFDPQSGTSSSATFRKGRQIEVGKVALSLVSGDGADAWTLLATSESMDDNRPARIRETTVRDGDSLSALKEVDFLDDEAEEWLSRNRIVLARRND